MSMVLPSQAYELKLAPHPAPFSVLRFTGRDALCELYCYEIEFTSDVAGIPMDQVLGRPAKFIIEPIDADLAYLQKMFGENAEQFSKTPPARTVHGIVTCFDELETSPDQTRYRVVLEPKLADLNRGITSRLFQKQSVEEIITDTLRHFGFRSGVDFEFKLRDEYKRHEYITQYHETTFAFIRRIAAQEGIWFRFEQRKDRAVVVFGDDLDAYARHQRVVPLRHDAGLESVGAEAIKSLERHTKRVVQGVSLNDYNQRTAAVKLLVDHNAAPDDKTTDAIEYRWGEHYQTLDEGRRIARLRHEALLANQVMFAGTGNPFALEAGEVMRLEQNPADAPHGLLITSVESSGGRGESYAIKFQAIPAHRVWRLKVDAATRPSIQGILPARVTSPGNYKYAYLNEQGHYVVKLPFDLDEWSPGGTSRPVRLSKPYSGDNYGHHFPLIDGTEVALIFTQGNPDRPVIVGAMHDSEHPDLINNLNHTRNLIRTAARNEIRLEDKEGIEHVHLTTPFRASELNLGHMVDTGHNERGQGAELRSDGPIAVRGKGILISAEVQEKAQGKQLDMATAQSQLEEALVQMKALSKAAQTAQALASDVQNQQRLLEERLVDLRKSALLASAPDGMAFTSGQHLQFSAIGDLIATSGGSADVGAMKDVRVAAANALSLFAQAGGVKLIAGKRDLIAQAQSGQLLLSSEKDVKIHSTSGRTTIASKGALTLTSGGAYIKIENGSIEMGCPGDITLKCGNFHWEGAANLPESDFPWPGQIPTALSTRVVLDKQLEEWIGAGAPIPYQFIDQSGTVISKGLTDNYGMTQRIYHKDLESLTVLFGQKGAWTMSEHAGSDCGCGIDHASETSADHMDRLSIGVEDRSGTTDDSRIEAAQRPETERLTEFPGEARSRELQQSLLEQLVYNDSAVRQAILEGEA